jgi:DNA repair exonuclease SbcCD ATPase subunit
VDQKAKTLIIEYPARPGYKLLDRKPAETTASSYRFEVKLAPGATEKFPVTEERVYDNSFGISNLTPDVLITYVQNKALSDAGRKQLEQIASLKSQIAATDADARRAEGDINALSRDQERMRQNIASLNQVAGQQQQVQSYAKQLADQESRLAALRDRTAELQRKKASLESELNAVIEKMDF